MWNGLVDYLICLLLFWEGSGFSFKLIMDIQNAKPSIDHNNICYICDYYELQKKYWQAESIPISFSVRLFLNCLTLLVLYFHYIK